ncbi:hypothetical protein FRC06_006439 [Ceratobasidium sp. 370]|nr:hypothetical protein FRC06_006439 [Ceratobasidium sp. 370]
MDNSQTSDRNFYILSRQHITPQPFAGIPFGPLHCFVERVSILRQHPSQSASHAPQPTASAHPRPPPQLPYTHAQPIHAPRHALYVQLEPVLRARQRIRRVEYTINKVREEMAPPDVLHAERTPSGESRDALNACPRALEEDVDQRTRGPASQARVAWRRPSFELVDELALRGKLDFLGREYGLDRRERNHGRVCGQLAVVLQDARFGGDC